MDTQERISFDNVEIGYRPPPLPRLPEATHLNRPGDEKKIRQILDRRLIWVPAVVRAFLPPVLSDPKLSWAIVREPAYFLVVFLSESDQKRVRKRITDGEEPFPGLITTAPDADAAIQLEDRRNVRIENCEVKERHAILLGKDATAVLVNHRQSVKTTGTNPYEYKIDLAYLVSYGGLINRATWDDYLENLIVYSSEIWRRKHAE